MKSAVFSCLGLGDGLLALILSHNLHLSGDEVVTFHPFLAQLQSLFPHLPIRPFPPDLTQFDRFFIIYERTDWMQAVLEECLKKYRAHTTVLNPIATPNTDYPFWEEGKFDGNLTFAQNLYLFCRDQLKIPGATKENGLISKVEKKHPSRVILHPTSSRLGKNWTAAKFLLLAENLSAQGLDPVFIVSPEERKTWPQAPAFSSLLEMATFVGESGYMIGNDSGIGHLASCFGVPTLTICKNERTANFWRPDWAPSVVCLPVGWLPNIKWLRWRDQHWQWGVSVKIVLDAFDQLRILCHEGAGRACLGKEDVVREA